MRTTCSALLALCLFGLAATEQGSIRLAAAATTSCADEPECDRLANEARDLSKAGRFDEAQRAYERAYQRRADPTLLFNLARVLHKAGRPAIAVIYYQKFLDVHGPVSVDERRKVEGYLKQAQAEAEGKTPPSSAVSPTPVSPAPVSPASEPTALSPASEPVKTVAPATDTPLYRKWWLWTAVGAGVGILVIGLSAGLAPRRPDLTGLPEAHPFGN